MLVDEEKIGITFIKIFSTEIIALLVIVFLLVYL